jgi:hypothetical protein
MSAFMHDVARASLPVAIVLLVLAVIARAVVAARFGDEQSQRTARQYLEPFSTWCLVAVATNALALGLTGEAELPAFVVPIGLGVAAALLRTEVQAGEPAPTPEPAPAPAVDDSLWA